MLSQRLRELDSEKRQGFIARLNADDFAYVEEQVADITGEGWRTDPASMAAHLDPRFEMSRHIRYLSRKFRQLTLPRGHPDSSKRQIWNLPGRYAKSSLARRGLVWIFDRHPEARSMYICYGDDLADEGADEVRQVLRDHRDVLRCELRRDRQRLDRFVTSAGGGLLGRGINSAITGFGVGDGGGIVLDDPYKNWQEAHSEARRRAIAQSFKGTLLNRLDDDEAWILLIHHRMHEADLTAQLAEEMEQADEYADQWDVSSLAALAEPGDPLGRAVGEPLWPERFPRHVVLRRAAGLGSYLASALEQQRPAPEEGNDIKRAWFTLDANMPAEWDDSLSSWDTALKDKETSDFTVGQLWARAGSTFWCVHEIRGRFDQPTMRAAVALMSVRYPWNLRHVVEHAAAGPEVIAQVTAGSGPDYRLSEEMCTALSMTDAERLQVEVILRVGLPGVQGQTVRGDKRVRARAVTPLIEPGNVHLPESGAWVPGFLDEVAAFPNGAHDDRVDAMSQALSRLWGTEATFVQPDLLLTSRIPSMGRRFD